MNKSLVSVALATAALFAIAGTGHSEDYRDAARHFSLTIPRGWSQMLPKRVSAINKVIEQKLAALKVRYDTGFAPKDALMSGYPYVLVQIISQNMSGATYDAIEQGLAKDMPGKVKEVKGKLADLVSDLDFQGTTVNREFNRIITRADTKVVGVGTVRGLSVGTIGSQGIVFLHCYAKQDEFVKYQPAFNAMIDSFRYDPGFSFSPGQSAPNRPFQRVVDTIRSGMVGAVIGALGGLIAAAAVAVTFALLKRRKKQRKATEADLREF